ncbi:MAG: hypothetical protein ACMUIP_07140 [bacterium]
MKNKLYYKDTTKQRAKKIGSKVMKKKIVIHLFFIIFLCAIAVGRLPAHAQAQTPFGFKIQTEAEEDTDFSNYKSIMGLQEFYYANSHGSPVGTGNIAGTFARMWPVQRFEWDTPYGFYGQGTSVASLLQPALAGAAILRANASIIGAMDRQLAESVLYTDSGMSYYATTGYYNPFSEIPWFFPSEISTIVAGFETALETPFSRYLTSIGTENSVYNPGIITVPYEAGDLVTESLGAGDDVIGGIPGAAYGSGYSAGLIGGTIVTPAGVPQFTYGYGGHVSSSHGN